MSAYTKIRSPQPSADERHQRTTARLQSIRLQLSNAPRGAKLKDKVCVITGVGSLKGIG